MFEDLMYNLSHFFRPADGKTLVLNKFKSEGFTPSRCIRLPVAGYTVVLAVDGTKKQLGIGSYHHGQVGVQLIEAKNILACEIIEDGDSITNTSTAGMAGRAVLGGALFGGVGAVIGGVTASTRTRKSVNRLDLRILIADLNDPIKTLPFIIGGIDKQSSAYQVALKDATNWFGVIKVLMHKE